MKFEVEEEICKSASKCVEKFKCLTDGLCGLCETGHPIAVNSMFIRRCKNEYKHNKCPYSMSYGLFSYICKCPVRYEIFRKYHK